MPGGSVDARISSDAAWNAFSSLAPGVGLLLVTVIALERVGRQPRDGLFHFRGDVGTVGGDYLLGG